MPAPPERPVPRTIVVTYQPRTRSAAASFTLYGLGLVWAKRVYESLSDLQAFLSKHDYRYERGSQGVWRLP